MKNKKKWSVFVAISVFLLLLFIILATYIYHRDKRKYEPKLWIGFFDYRINFRDVGASLNQCLGKNIFKTGLVYRSNKYFSGWSCDKVNNPQKIYSLNYNPDYPHAYYCMQKDGSHLVGFHPNTTFEIQEIENLGDWERPEFKSTMCTFFNDTLDDLVNKRSFLFHCDMGRDRTGAFAALLTMMLAEKEHEDDQTMINAIECDYEKTHAIEAKQIGHMKSFMEEMKARGGVASFIEKECGISGSLIEGAAKQFFTSN